MENQLNYEVWRTDNYGQYLLAKFAEYSLAYDVVVLLEKRLEDDYFYHYISSDDYFSTSFSILVTDLRYQPLGDYCD